MAMQSESQADIAGYDPRPFPGFVRITAITASEVDPSVVGVAISWAGIVGVNWVHARSLRKKK